jgi:hypothetical protein
MDGGGNLTKTGSQARILMYERLLSAVGRANQPRLYVFDGDHGEDEQWAAQKMRTPDGNSLHLFFMPVLEIENYLLDVTAIAKAISDEATALGLRDKPAEGEVECVLRNHFPTEFNNLKGSEVLQVVYDQFGLTYNKRKSGSFIAKHLPLNSEPVKLLGEMIHTRFVESRSIRAAT